ncbi:GNAT family N-acetyltransferase [Zhouia amylolytica]|uniref:GNAT family N-acetyltransferase n=1 Tax=Zhouia amylolytica TaxID=376730 RepID=UPI00056F9E71|nr:GNAT family N-acetyltransferase [Zhouia amylolytica]
MTNLSYQTERLWVRPTNLEDADFILELFNSPKWLTFIGDRQLQTREDAVRYIEDNMLSQLKRLGYGNYTVIRKSDQKKIGAIGLYDREDLDDIDLGFAFLSEFEGNGYAFESVKVLTELAINTFQLNRLIAITLPVNVGAQNLLTKLGFEFERMIHRNHPQKDWMLYRIKH